MDTDKSKYLQEISRRYRMDESECVETLLELAALEPEAITRIQERARQLVVMVRTRRLGKGGLDAFLFEYDLSSEEGIVLMCLAEALLRIPDSETVDKFIKDKITQADWEQHLGKSTSSLVNAATWALMLTGKVIRVEKTENWNLASVLKRLVSRSGEPIIRQAIGQAMRILGRQFVMGRDIEEALKRAKISEKKGYRYSYDMLGEAAKTEKDAAAYLYAYENAIDTIGDSAQGLGPIKGPGVSVKLSALHPRYEYAQRERILNELLPRLKSLALKAKSWNIGFTIDAEEAERLELSLELVAALMADPDLAGWQGFGLAVQAYQKRAIAVVEYLCALAKTHQRPLMVRLVKGAYWDSEIKWTQERGLCGYPVFTRKAATDVSYLACAKRLLAEPEYIYPQFATHNAYSVAAILEMAQPQQCFEFQCLHGMGDALYDSLLEYGKLALNCRVYAPVGSYENLLAYLVRRLLENGANTSFVNRIIDERAPIEELIMDPILKIRSLVKKPHPLLPIPLHLYGSKRLNSQGLDLSNPIEILPILKAIEESRSQEWHSQPTSVAFDAASRVVVVNPADHRETVGLAASANRETALLALDLAQKAALDWSKSTREFRTLCLQNLATLLEQQKPQLIAILVREAGKILSDANAEVREAVDFCWYYAARCLEDFAPKVMPGPTGEYNQLALQGRGVIACISPWNFPLAIFIGQVTAALAAGNAVIAKPATQTPLIAAFAMKLVHQAGIPADVAQLLPMNGPLMSEVVLSDSRIQAVMFTGSTETARAINLCLAQRIGPIVPFIAETGGQNAMIVDSSALPEQVISDVILSAFGSSGQRCSSLRVLFIQADVAPKMIEMLQGAMAELSLGDPAFLHTDIGPVIDKKSLEMLKEHEKFLSEQGQLLYQVSIDKAVLQHGNFFAPCAYEIENLLLLKKEVFGPILHVIRYKASQLDQVIDSINATGYGLTLGIHSRINETVQYIHARVRVGNTYVNRNMIGAVVGVQPFGGEGLSGTGPKAGGPHYLTRLAIERSLSINTAAAGGNTSLMTLSE